MASCRNPGLRASPRSRCRLGSVRRRSVVVRELAAVAEYIKHIKREIGALRANELCRDRHPDGARGARQRRARRRPRPPTRSWRAAEEILGSDEASLERYRDAGRDASSLDIFEACAFQDLTGQRIAKVLDALRQLEKRLGRFAQRGQCPRRTPIRARSGGSPARRRAARCAAERPAGDGHGIAQDDIDKMFA